MLDGVVIGFLAKFPLHKADDFAVVKGRLALFDREDRRRDSLGIDLPLPPQVPKPLIDQAEQACRGKTAGFRAHDGPLTARLPTAFGNGFRKQHNRPNHFVIMLNIVDKVELVRRKVLRSSHAIPPPRGFNRPTTA